MDVLDAGGDARHVDVVAAHLARHVGQVGDRGDDLQLVGSQRARCERAGESQCGENSCHGDAPHRSLKLWTWLPRMTVHWTKNSFSCSPGDSRRVYCSRSRWNSDAQIVKYGEYASVSPTPGLVSCTHSKRNPG